MDAEKHIVGSTVTEADQDEMAAGKDRTMKSLLRTVQSSFDNRNRLASRQGSRLIVVLFVAVAILAGCQDPNVRKQKYFESGMRYSSQGKYSEAAIQFSNALKVDKNYADAHYGLAKAYLHLGRFGPAYAELARTVDLQPSNCRARLDLGSLLLAGGKIDAAKMQANAVTTMEPNDPDLHALLSGIAFRNGQKDVALTEMQRALQLDPSRAGFYQDLALLQMDDPSKASAVEDELKKAIVLNPKSVNTKLMLATFYAKNSRWPEAEQAAQDAIATDPKSLQARESLAQIFLRQGDQSKTEETLRHAASDLKDNPQAVRAVADYYERTGQVDKARAEFTALAAKYPDNLSLQEEYVRVLLEVKDLATARTVTAGLMKKHEKDPHVLALNGIVLLNDGKANEAVIALQGAAKDYPKDAFIQFWLGKSALAVGDIALAEGSFRQAEELNPTRMNAYEELAQLALQRNDMDLLYDVAGKAVTVAPRFAGGYLWRAIAEMSKNTLDKAEADLKTAMEIAPQSAAPYFELARIRYAQKRFPEGVKLLDQALQYDPNSIEALGLLVSYDLNQKQPAKALARVNDQIAKSPKNSGFYDLLAQLQVQNKNLDQAAATAQKAIQINPADPEATLLFAQIESQLGKTADAIAVWEQWANAHPDDAGAYSILGTLEESRGNRSKAEDYYKKSLKIQPQQPLAANNLAYMMLMNGENADVALTLAQTARRAMPNSASTADTLAWAYYTKGAYGFARDLLEGALKSDANNATLQYHLGMVYGKLGDKDNAAAHLRKAISIAPDSQPAKDAKTALQALG